VSTVIKSSAQLKYKELVGLHRRGYLYYIPGGTLPTAPNPLDLKPTVANTVKHGLVNHQGLDTGWGYPETVGALLGSLIGRLRHESFQKWVTRVQSCNSTSKQIFFGEHITSQGTCKIMVKIRSLVFHTLICRTALQN
jgi:hypothetical protein